MKIHREMIKRYTTHLTSGIGVTKEEPMADLSNFDRDIQSMAAEARQDNNLDWLYLSLDALIANPTGRIKLFADYVYPFKDDELHKLFSYSFQKIWPDKEISAHGSEADLHFVAMTDEEWAKIIDLEEVF